MPRVRAAASGTTASPMKSVQIPLNDDRQEKAQRLQSRQAAHTKQREQYKAAAASPAKKRKSLGEGGGGPSTPSQDASSYDSQQYGMVAGSAVTPMKRVPILANFEEWMKMATDNKINASNSWNFALIDYFHDMSLLREGDGVNFQKASCTLDGCVKIYTSRVDSVATETGKLLSGLAESKGGRRRGEDAEGEGGEEDEEDEGEESGKKKSRKRPQRSAEATLANSFESLRLKKMELEFSVDPLFKKASADFDEGGAKGLLLNHLSIDSTGRIVFDSSDDAQEGAGEDTRRDSMDPEGTPEREKEEGAAEATLEDGPLDIAGLGARFFPDLSRLDDQDICPSLKSFELGAGDASLDLPFLKAPDNWRDEHGDPTSAAGQQDDQTAIPHSDDNNFGLQDDDDGFDLPPSTGFGEGGEAWARDAALHPQTRLHSTDPTDDAGEVGTFDTHSTTYGVTLAPHHRGPGQEEQNILHYFDAALHQNKNWAGPEHWKITRLKSAAAQAQPKEKATRKEKEPFEIDFLSPLTPELAGMLYTPADKRSGIDLPKKDWRARGRNLLPDDKHFSSRDLLRLFLKPRARIGARLGRGGSGTAGRWDGAGEVDEAYWAANSDSAAAAPPHGQREEDAVRGDYDADFFQDDNLPYGMDAGGEVDDEEFADAREHFSPGVADDVDAAGAGLQGAGIDGILAGGTQDGAAAFGANLVAQSRRLRPEYVQYARVAKKVDVRRLKEEMWRGIGFGEGQAQAQDGESNSSYFLSCFCGIRCWGFVLFGTHGTDEKKKKDIYRQPSAQANKAETKRPPIPAFRSR